MPAGEAMPKPFLLAMLFSLSAPLLAQQYVDVLHDGIYVYNASGPAGSDRLIYRLDADGSREKIAVSVPKTVGFIGRPRPRVRFGRIWISNGKKMFSAPLDQLQNRQAPQEAPLEPGGEWEPVRLPEGINRFEDFDIISDTDAMICGCLWELSENDKTVPARYDMHFVFDHRTGAIKKTIEALEPYDVFPELDYYSLRKLSGSYLCRFGQYVLVVGAFTGKMTVFDTDKGRAAEHQVIPAEDIPEDPNLASNNGRAISWVGPLAGGDVLLCCRKLLPLPEGKMNYFARLGENGEETVAPSPFGQFRWEFCFRTMSLKTGKAKDEGAQYRGFDANDYQALFERDGELLSVRDITAGGARAGAHAAPGGAQD